MIVDKKVFAKGVISIILFFIVLVIFFSPVFNGHNGLEYLDNLYNSISKGSAYFIPKAKEEAGKLKDSQINLLLKMGSPQMAEQTAHLFKKSEANVEISNDTLKVTGDLGKIINNCIEDADMMYKNKGEMIYKKYGYDERQVLYNWWVACKEMDKDLKRHDKFSEAKSINFIKEKAVETAYNYYKIQPQKITDRLGWVIFSLIFYVLYTLWYGYSIMFLFEGWGMNLDNH